MGDPIIEAAARKGSAELLILSALEDGQLHGYDIAREISRRSDGLLTFHVASLYPAALQARGSDVDCRDAGSRRPANAAAAITVSLAEGKRVLAKQRSRWEAFVGALTKAAGLKHA